ncbi:hypothetical protein B0A56_03835 [Flavobacterium columnare NBRC 100251 = ATCC 23463]|nr:hypothetical protein B0A56_03835 [Flavobacterium columnare NBRC 100251 = ATCC 23463]
MIRKYTKEEFEELDFDTKCVVMETLLTDDYFTGQMDIDFYFVEEENSTILPPKTKEQEEREMREFNLLIEKLTDKLFGTNEEIELDIEKILNS